MSGLAAGADQIVNVQWPAALVPPEFVMVGMTNVTWHPCLLVECSPLDGPATGGNHVADSNSLAQKNISIVYTDAGTDFAMAIVAGNEENLSECLILEIDRGYLPREVSLYVDLVNPALKRKLRTWLAAEREKSSDGRWQEKPQGIGLQRVVAGARAARQARQITIGHHRGQEVAFLSPRGKTRIPICGGPGTLHAIIVDGRGWYASARVVVHHSAEQRRKVDCQRLASS